MSFTDAIASAAVGGAAVAVSLPKLWRSARAYAWLRAEGHVTATWTYEVHGAAGGVRYGTGVGYTYVVAGREFLGDQVAFDGGRTYLSPALAQTELDRRWPAGAPVTVYYDPSRPSQAVLVRDVSVGLAIVALLGLGLLVHGGAELVTALR